MTKPEIAIALYALYDRLWVKSEGVISKDESRALMEAAQFFQLEGNVVAVVEPTEEWCTCTDRCEYQTGGKCRRPPLNRQAEPEAPQKVAVTNPQYGEYLTSRSPPPVPCSCIGHCGGGMLAFGVYCRAQNRPAEPQ